MYKRQGQDVVRTEPGHERGQGWGNRHLSLVGDEDVYKRQSQTLAQLKKASKLVRLAFHKNGPKSYKRGPVSYTHLKNTPYHGQILKLMKGNMSLIRKRMTA